jgi:hypothetical protein
VEHHLGPAHGERTVELVWRAYEVDARADLPVDLTKPLWEERGPRLDLETP